MVVPRDAHLHLTRRRLTYVSQVGVHNADRLCHTYHPGAWSKAPAPRIPQSYHLIQLPFQMGRSGEEIRGHCLQTVFLNEEGVDQPYSSSDLKLFSIPNSQKGKKGIEK